MTTRRDVADHLSFYREIGVAGVSRDPSWRERARDDHQSVPEAAVDIAAPERVIGAAMAPPGADGNAADALAALRAHIGDCTRCKLHAQGRRQVVFGVGNPTADLMFVGEAPGSDEDEQGEPFVGRAGQLLTKIIESIGRSRADVYIANVIKCRPPSNRNPEPDEVATCEPFLASQIAIIKPRVIVALGKFAAHLLLRTDVSISQLRGRVHEFAGGAKLMPTFHPAYLLRSPEKKREVWEDMKTVRALLDAPVGE